MKASELRLGNWVHDGSNFPMQVVGIFEDVVYLDFEGNEGDVWECKIQDLKAFEWNEEWIEYFGFKTHQHLSYWSKGNFTFQKDKKTWYWRMEPIYTDLTMYVHQIQNLYHALTGEEL